MPHYVFETSCRLAFASRDDALKFAADQRHQILNSQAIGIIGLKERLLETTELAEVHLTYSLLYSSEFSAGMARRKNRTMIFATNPVAIVNFTDTVRIAEVMLRIVYAFSDNTNDDLPDTGDIPKQFPIARAVGNNALAMRMRNALGITHLSQLTQFTRNELSNARSIGERTINPLAGAMIKNNSSCDFNLDFLPRPAKDTLPPSLAHRQLDLIPLRALRIVTGAPVLKIDWVNELENAQIITADDLRSVDDAKISDIFWDGRNHESEISQSQFEDFRKAVIEARDAIQRDD